MSSQNAPARCTLASCTILYEMIEEERDRLNKKVFDLKLQMNEMKQTLEKERDPAIEDVLKKAKENAQLNQLVVAEFKATIDNNLEKISRLDKQLLDEQLKFTELEKVNEASKAELDKNNEELSRLRGDMNKLLNENQQLKENEKGLHDQVHGLKVEATQASSLNNQQQEKITSLEHELQASKETLSKVAHLVNGKQQTDHVAPVGPFSSPSFVDNSFDGFSTEDQQPLGAEPFNTSKNSTYEEVDAEQVSEAVVDTLPSFSREPGFSNGSSFAQAQHVSEEVAAPIVKTPSRVTRPHRDGVDYGTKLKKPVRPLNDKRRASPSAAIHPIKKTKKDSRRQNNDNDELDFNSVDLFDNLYKRLNAESTAGVHQNPVIFPNLRSRSSSVTYNDDIVSNSDEADNYSDSEDTTTGIDPNNISPRSRSCSALIPIKWKFTAKEYEFQPCIIHDKVVVFAPGNMCYHYQYQVTNKNYRCSRCSDKHKKHSVCGTIERDTNGKEYFLANVDHVCKPRKYSTKSKRFRGSDDNIKVYDFERVKTSMNGVKIVVPVMNDRNMCYFFSCRYDKENLYVCKRCASHKPPRYVPGGFGKDEDGKEYFETPNDHVCEPRDYNPAEIIKTNAHHSQIHP